MKAAAGRPGMRRCRTIALAEIREFAEQIAARFRPRKIILFGSRAHGDARTGSDVDLLVVVDAPPAQDASLEIRRKITYDFPVDIVVVDERRLRKRVQAGDFLLRDAVTTGKVLYERPDR
jgi:predicted nucleotidyltransferase